MSRNLDNDEKREIERTVHGIVSEFMNGEWSTLKWYQWELDVISLCIELIQECGDWAEWFEAPMNVDSLVQDIMFSASEDDYERLLAILCAADQCPRCNGEGEVCYEDGCSGDPYMGYEPSYKMGRCDLCEQFA